MKTVSILLLCFAALTVLVAEQPSSLPQQAKAHFSIEKMARSDNGDLVVCIRIFAGSTDLPLQGKSSPDNAEKEREGDQPPSPPFSLAHAYLLDPTTGERTSARPTLPSSPYFGPMDVITVVSKGGWIQMGVAFPNPIKADSNGKKVDRKLMLYLPLDAQPVSIVAPNE